MEQLQGKQWCNQYAYFCIHIPTLHVTVLHKINIKFEFIYAAAGIT